MDTLSFSQAIVTPSGTPLGGNIELQVQSNGEFHIKFHMHSSSIFGDFDYDLRVYLTAPNCPTFFFHHRGHVSGVDSEDYPESGSNPLIGIYWPLLKSKARFSAAKDYEWGGVVGTLEGLIQDVFDIGAAAVGISLGAVIGVTREAIGWIGANLGVGGTIGVISGVAVFVVLATIGAPIGVALILGTVAGVAAGVLANEMIKQRPLSQAETAFATRMFGNSLSYDKIILTNLSGLGGRAFTVPGVEGRIYCNLGSKYNDTLGSYFNSYPAPGQLLIHELTHAWQIEHASFLPGLVCSAIVNQADKSVFGDDIYNFGPAGPDWSSFNLEQQASIVDQWFGGNQHSAGYKPMDQINRYYRYIWNDLLSRIPPPSAPSNLRASSSFCAARTPDHLDVFWVGPDGAIGSNWWDLAANNAQWNQPFPLTPPNAAHLSAVAVVSRIANHIDVFWVGPDGAVMSNWWDLGANNAQWNQPFPLTPPNAAQPGAIAAVARTPDHLDVFWVGPDGAIGSNWWDLGANNAQWNQPFPLTPPNAAAQPGAIPRPFHQ